VEDRVEDGVEEQVEDGMEDWRLEKSEMVYNHERGHGLNIPRLSSIGRKATPRNSGRSARNSNQDSVSSLPVAIETIR
jgi:hypothetical protein